MKKFLGMILGLFEGYIISIFLISFLVEGNPEIENYASIITGVGVILGGVIGWISPVATIIILAALGIFIKKLTDRPKRKDI